MTGTLLKNSFSEYTEAEFVELLEELAREDREADNDDRADLLLLHFEKVSGHPAGSDLIYYPEPGADSSPEAVMQIVKEWRAANSLPGFKRASEGITQTVKAWRAAQCLPGFKDA